MKVFLNEKARESDIRCVILARLGFGHRFITAQTGMASHQITYRLNKLGLRISDYREGRTPLAHAIAESVKVDAVGIAARIRQLIANGHAVHEPPPPKRRVTY